MKKVLLYTPIAIILLVSVWLYVIYRSIERFELPHGAVLHVLPASKIFQTHNAIVLCPGGGYNFLERKREGYMWFPFYYFKGYTVALLDYRLPDEDHQSPKIDGSEAIRLMREHAREWGYDENNVGMMGFSAGGHLVSTMMVSDDASVRPDYAVLFYPIISMKKELTHYWAYLHLLGKNPSEELENRYSNELHVSNQTSPAYIVVCSDDKVVDPQNAICFYEEMRANNCSVTLRVYPSGGHGWGYRLTFAHHRQMVKELAAWLKNRQSQITNNN